jgi:hypothetical protein
VELVANRVVESRAALETDGAGYCFAAWTLLLTTLGMLLLPAAIGLFVLLGLVG